MGHMNGQSKENESLFAAFDHLNYRKIIPQHNVNVLSMHIQHFLRSGGFICNLKANRFSAVESFPLSCLACWQADPPMGKFSAGCWAKSFPSIFPMVVLPPLPHFFIPNTTPFHSLFPCKQNIKHVQLHFCHVMCTCMSPHTNCESK